MTRVLLLLLAAVCGVVAALSNSDWGWFGIDYDPADYRTFMALGFVALVLSFMPWSEWRRRYEG